MTSFNMWLQRGLALLLAMILVLPFGAAAPAQAQQNSPAQPSAASPPQDGSQASPPPEQPAAAPAASPAPDTSQQPSVPAEQPSGPVPAPTPGQESAPSSSGAATATPQPDASQQPSLSKRSDQQANQVPTAPVGTAVAPYEKGIGVGASRPAGAVIAPAKQRRTRSFLIKSALVLGAAVAVGTVIGLSNSSPSRPSN